MQIRRNGQNRFTLRIPDASEPDQLGPDASEPAESEPTQTQPTESEPTQNQSKPTDAPSLHGHSYAVTVTEPTCTAKGYTTYTCACGHSYRENETPATGHSWSAWTVTRDGSCKQEQISERSCSACNSKETKQSTGLHSYDQNGVCTVCSKQVSTGLGFTISRDGTYYIVSYGLVTVRYLGTKAQWSSIQKESSSFYSTSNYTVQCTNGQGEKS